MNTKFIKILGLFFISFSAFSKTYHGKLNVEIVDYFEENKSQTIYELIDGENRYTLNLPSNIDKSSLLSGVEVTLDGEILFQGNGRRIKVKKIQINTFQAPAAKNNIKNLTLLVDFTDLKTSQVLSKKDVDSILYTASDSTKINFERSTFNQVSINPDTNGDGVSDIYSINLNYAAGNNCNYQQWAADAKAAAKKQGINTSLYQFFTFVLPGNISCDWGGLATLGCSDACNAWIRSYPINQNYSKIVFTHELGHLLGMHHSAIDANNDGQMENEYGDDTCFMGTGAFTYWKELNAPHRDQMKWLDAYPKSLRKIYKSGKYTLFPLESGVENNNLLILKFLKADTSEYYYLSFRKNIGPFGPGTTNAVNKVSIHKAASSGITYFIQALGVNEKFVDDINKINVTVVSMSDNSASVRVNFNSENAQLKAFSFFNHDNTFEVGYTDWDEYYWKGNCPPYSEPVGLSSSVDSGNAQSIACLIKDKSTTTATGEFVSTLTSYTGDERRFSREGDWDVGYFKWECGLNEYVSGFSQDIDNYQLHKIRCAKGQFSNGGQNACETRFVHNGGDDRGSNQGDDWEPGYFKAQCSDGKLIFGVSVDLMSLMPHKILCCNK